MSDHVWIVESGCYSSAMVVGVYRTIKDVVAAFPVDREPQTMSERPGGWMPDVADDALDPDSWWNGLDLGDLMCATRHPILPPSSEGSLTSPP